MSSISRRSFGLVALCLLVACSPLRSSHSETLEMTGDVLVAEAHAFDDGVTWSGSVGAAKAQAGDYVVFSSDVEPTNVAAAMTFDPGRDCASSGYFCTVPGLGTYGGRAVLDAPGQLSIKLDGPADGKSFWVIAARRGPAPSTGSQKVVVDLELTKGGLCDSAPREPTIERIDAL